jgi:tRNA/tmRNA/rRNA uracil-C5-methylase (TrmA/RlmC/RlmD family)
MIESSTPEFKRASIGLLISIIQNVNSKKSKKYYSFFQKELKINPEEFEEIVELQSFTQAHNIVLENEIDTIRKALGNKRHQIMKFLMILNRCIIIDGCDAQSYQRFEEVRDSFLAKL